MKRFDPLTFWAGLVMVVVCLFIAGWLVWNFDPFGRRKAAEGRAVQATQQAQVNGNAAAAVDRYHTQTTIIREKADAAVEQVQEQPGAASPVPADLLSAWRDGIGQLRKPAEGGDADDPGEPTS